MKRSETKAGPKFRAGQVVYDSYQGMYFKCDAGLAKELNTTKSTEWIRPLTARESGQRQRKGKG